MIDDMSKTIETWKLDLERLLWSYHEGGRPDGKTGLIGNPRTIEQFVQSQKDLAYKQGKDDGFDKGFTACEENIEMGKMK